MGLPLWLILAIAVLSAIIIAPMLFFLGVISGNVWFAFGLGLLGIVTFTLAILIIFAIILFLIWRILPRAIQVILVVLLFLFGVLTFDWELILVAVLGAIYTSIGVGSRRRVGR